MTKLMHWVVVEAFYAALQNSTLPSPGNGCAPQSRSMRPVKRRFHTRCCHAESKIVADLHVWTSRCIWGFWSFRSMFRFYLAVQNPNFNCLWSPVGFHFILISLSYTAVYIHDMYFSPLTKFRHAFKKKHAAVSFPFWTVVVWCLTVYFSSYVWVSKFYLLASPTTWATEGWLVNMIYTLHGHMFYLIHVRWQAWRFCVASVAAFVLVQ